MPITEQDPASYRTAVHTPEDFDDFWARTLTFAEPLDARFEPVWSRAITVHDVTFNGFGGQPVKAWLALPSGATTRLGCVVEFPGYGGGRGLPHQCLLYAAAGYAHLFMDVRGQGSGWRAGDTPDANSGDPRMTRRGFASSTTLSAASRDEPLSPSTAPAHHVVSNRMAVRSSRSR